jgi:hypothetical protein
MTLTPKFIDISLRWACHTNITTYHYIEPSQVFNTLLLQFKDRAVLRFQTNTTDFTAYWTSSFLSSSSDWDVISTANILDADLLYEYHAPRGWLRRCARSRRDTGSIPDYIIRFFNLPNPCSSTVAVKSTQPPTWSPSACLDISQLYGPPRLVIGRDLLAFLQFVNSIYNIFGLCVNSKNYGNIKTRRWLPCKYTYLHKSIQMVTYIYINISHKVGRMNPNIIWEQFPTWAVRNF